MKMFVASQKTTLAGLTALLLSAGISLADEPEIGATLLWESDYISEGRNNLDEGGLLSVEAAAASHGVELGVWYGWGDQDSYDELNLSIGYGFSVGQTDLALGYTRLEFPQDDESDNEISAGLAVNELPWIVPSVDSPTQPKRKAAFSRLHSAQNFCCWKTR